MADFAFANICHGSCSKADTVVLELRASDEDVYEQQIFQGCIVIVYNRMSRFILFFLSSFLFVISPSGEVHREIRDFHAVCRVLYLICFHQAG